MNSLDSLILVFDEWCKHYDLPKFSVYYFSARVHLFFGLEFVF